MPQLPIADKTTLDAVNTKTGANTDAAGTTTLFARLKQVYDYLTTNLSTTRTAKIDNLDGTVTSRASQTSVSTIDTKIGANTDPAGTTTLFARLAQLANNLPIQPTKFKLAGSTVNSPVANTWYTVINVSGKGIVTGMSNSASSSGSTAISAEIRITIDGVPNVYTYATSGFVEYYGNGYTVQYNGIQLYFKSSFTVEVRGLSSTFTSISASSQYALE